LSARSIDGNAIAKLVRAQWRERVCALHDDGAVPGLAVIVVGDDPASHVYATCSRAARCSRRGSEKRSGTLPPSGSACNGMRRWPNQVPRSMAR
jgi:methylenetetrahydrofolate dehydrogenase (NADP+)/methenyltetrahydrofolate cyclohydrolase